MSNYIEHSFKYVLFILGCIIAYFEPIIMMACVVFAIFTTDFVTGVAASFKEGKTFRSSVARWSFVKLIIYLGHAALVFFVCDNMGISKETAVNVVKIVIWAVIYVEGLSVNENLLRLYPDNKFIKFMHHLLSVEFLRYMPVLANYFKDSEKDKFNG